MSRVVSQHRRPEAASRGAAGNVVPNVVPNVGPAYEMRDYAWFRLGGYTPGLPRPFYLGRGVALDARYDSRRNPQQAMLRHGLVKLYLTDGAVAGGAGVGARPVRLSAGQAVAREVGDADAWDAYDPRHRGPVEFLGLIFAGTSAMTMLRSIVGRHGRVLDLSPETTAVRHLLGLAREPSHTVELSASAGMRLVNDVLLSLLEGAEARGRSVGRPRLAEAAGRAIATRLDRNYAVAELAAMHGVSREHLTRVFAREYGLGPAEYARQLKVREACRRLRQGDQSVKGIMYDLGFTSRATFVRAFRGVTGQTPAQYRRGGGASAD